MSVENIGGTDSQKKEKLPEEKQVGEGDASPSAEQQPEGAKTIYQAPQKEFEEEKVNLSKEKGEEKRKEPHREGVKYLGKPEASGHPVFSAQIRAADPFKRYGVPDSAAALPGTVARPKRRPGKK